MYRYFLLVLALFSFLNYRTQNLALARDTISVIENGKVLKMPWGNGINYSNVSNLDLNYDGKKDLVLYDRLNHINTGRFRCFIKTGLSGAATYSYAPDLSYFFPTVYNWAAFHDYNCDGREDLFCSTNSGIRVYRNEGSVNNPVNFVLVKTILLSDYNPGGPTFYSNIYASPVGVPGIADIDNDGDLDVLSFPAQGFYLEYHQNMSKESFGNCDSLVFEYRDYCWGKFSESSCNIALNQCSPKATLGPVLTEDGKTYHAGSCITCLDGDGDGDKDLILGDISCNGIQYAMNGGDSSTALISDTTILYPNFPAKNNTLQVKMNSFPCAYVVDVDGDNVKDLLASPSAFGSENYKSLWYYKNVSSTSTVNFQFVKKNLLQDEMIEVGQNAFPVLIDENADGLQDLLLGTYGYYTGNTLRSRLTLYRNIGSTSQPVYSLVTQDYDSLSKENLFHIMPTIGDVDGDGDEDMLMGNSTGQIHWLENTAGQGNPCNFSAFKNNPFSFTTLSAEAAPQLFDLDNDGKQDLLIGMKNGRIAYYRNVGSVGAPSFSLITNTLGNVDVKGNVNIYGIDGYAVPYFYKEGASTKLLVGSISGQVFYYDVPANPLQNFTLLNSSVNNYNEGAQSAPFYIDVNNDTKRDLFLGNAGGGLSFFSSASPQVAIQEFDMEQLDTRVHVFPNPGQDFLNVKIQEASLDKLVLSIQDISGRQMFKQAYPGSEATLDIKNYSAGLYFLRITMYSGILKRELMKPFIKSE